MLASRVLWVAAGRVKQPQGAIAILVVAALLGGVAGSSASRPGSLRYLAEHDGGLDGPWRIQGRVVREPTAAARGSTLTVDVDRVWLEQRWQLLHGRVELQIPEAPPRPNWYSGTRLEAWLRLQPDRPPANPARATTDRLRLRGIDLRARLKSYGQLRMRAPPASYLATLPGRARDFVRAQIAATFRRHPNLVRALLLGERRDLDETLLQDMARSGLIHLLAISGLHVGLLAMAPMAALRVLGRSPRAGWCAALGATLLLVFLVEPRAPIRRAATMTACLLAGRLAGRRIASTDALGFAILVIVAVDPVAPEQFGFQLSVAATAAIVLAGHRSESLLARMFGTSLAANSAVAPLLAIKTGTVPVAGLLLNVVAIPAVSAALVLAVVALMAAASGLVALPSGLSAGAEAMLDVVLACSRASASLGMGPVALASASTASGLLYGLGMIVAMRARRRRRIMGLLSMVVAGGLALQSPHQPAYPRLLALDVGQGDALLLVSADGAVLVDAGGYPGIDYDTGYRIVEPELRRLGIGRLEALAITHDHADHIGGVPTILRHFRVAELWLGATPVESETAARVFELAWARHTAVLTPTALERSIAGCRWRSFPAPGNQLRASAGSVKNEASLVLVATCGTKQMLLTGDAGTASERNWDLTRMAGAFLKVGHHGSASATSDRFLSRLRPRHAVVSVGAANPWSLPRSSVLARLRAHRTAVYRTDRDGALTVEFGARVRVRGERWRSGSGD